jgi:hypothetical protein
MAGSKSAARMTDKSSSEKKFKSVEQINSDSESLAWYHTIIWSARLLLADQHDPSKKGPRDVTEEVPETLDNPGRTRKSLLLSLCGETDKENHETLSVAPSLFQ